MENLISNSTLVETTSSIVALNYFIESLYENPSEVQLDGYNLVLTASLWRDFMPVSPSDGKPLISSIQLVDNKNKKIELDIMLKRQYVIKGHKVWRVDLISENGVQATCQGGPKWGPHNQVDVLAVFEYKGEKYSILKKGVEIQKTV